MIYRTGMCVAVCGCLLALLSGCGTQTMPSNTAQTSEPHTPGVDDVNTGLGVTDVSADAGGQDAGTEPHAAVPEHGEDHGRPRDATEALAELLEGNQRFVAGKSVHPHESADYRASLAHQQHPFATVLTCSDSRVTPVLIFDQGIGDLFVIRVAGNVIDEDIAGSIEYAVDHLGAQLLVILGHEDCGAVTAAYHSFVAKDLREREPHEIESLLMHIQPALRNLDRSKSEEEQITAAVEANVRESILELLRLPDVQQAQEKGLVKIVGAIYSVATGKVRLLDM